MLALVLALRSRTTQRAMSSAYLTAFPADALPERLRAAIAELEPQFDVDLHAVTKQMLWEYNEGLNNRVTADNADTFLPMMCVRTA